MLSAFFISSGQSSIMGAAPEVVQRVVSSREQFSNCGYIFGSCGGKRARYTTPNARIRMAQSNAWRSASLRTWASSAGMAEGTVATRKIVAADVASNAIGENSQRQPNR